MVQQEAANLTGHRVHNYGLYQSPAPRLYHGPVHNTHLQGRTVTHIHPTSSPTTKGDAWLDQVLRYLPLLHRHGFQLGLVLGDIMIEEVHLSHQILVLIAGLSIAAGTRKNPSPDPGRVVNLQRPEEEHQKRVQFYRFTLFHS